MRRRQRIAATPWFAIFVILFLLAGCGEPDRADYRDSAADEVCSEAERCETLDDLFTESYASHSECVVEEKSRFNDMWPADECDNGRIDEEAFESCMDRARPAACDGNWTDYLSALDACSADEVCTN